METSELDLTKMRIMSPIHSTQNLSGHFAWYMSCTGNINIIAIQYKNRLLCPTTLHWKLAPFILILYDCVVKLYEVTLTWLNIDYKVLSIEQLISWGGEADYLNMISKPLWWSNIWIPWWQCEWSLFLTTSHDSGSILTSGPACMDTLPSPRECLGFD